MTRAIRVHATGGPEAMVLDDVTLEAPASGQARVRHTAIGVNYLDTYHRSGLYTLPLPIGIGSEAAGVVEALGPGTDTLGLAVGQRVAYCGGPPGAYSEARNIPADRLVPLPDDIADRDAAALMLKGLTVEYLFRRTFPLKGGETIVFHAAAGGVGLIACQWAKALRVRMIGTVSSEEKAKLARDHGCAETIVYTREDFVARVKELTGGAGVPVVYDSIGKDTFPASLDCLQARGLFVSFGAASGPIPPFSIMLLSQKGSLYATRPTLFTYSAKRADLLDMAANLFALVRNGAIKADVRQTYPLADAALAHRALESRATTGASLLLP